MVYRLSLFTLFYVLTLGVPAFATTVAPLSDTAIAEDAVMIVSGWVTGIDSHWDAGQRQILSNISLSVEEVLKGELPDGTLTIKQIGGTLGNLRSWIIGNPEFSVGEKVLLFLKQNEDGTLRVAHLYQGKYSILANHQSSEEFAYQSLPEGVHAISPSGRSAAAPSSDYRLYRLPEFKGRIQRALQGRAAPRRSRPVVPVSHVASAATQSNEEFTLLGTARWFAPDSGSPVVMYTHQAGEPAAPTLGFSQTQQALAAWSNVSSAKFQYQNGGTTAVTGFRSDGVNAISFRDPAKQMDNPVGCSGTLAQGGYFSTTSQSVMVNEQRFYKIVEGDVVVNDGWEGCGFYENTANLAEVLTHELGHALGLGHSPDTSATMAAYAHFDGRGASLTADDEAGLAFIYPAAASSDTTVPTISSVSASLVGSSAATIKWTTNEASNTQVEYGKTTAYGTSTALNTSMVTSHTQALSGLSSNTLYHYRVKSRDAAGNLGVSGDFNFTTTVSGSDSTPPAISSVSTSNISRSGATIKWTTNEASDTQVEYGKTTAYGSTTALNATKVTSHTQSLTGLSRNTRYYYRVKSRDAAGNLAVSGSFTFQTKR